MKKTRLFICIFSILIAVTVLASCEVPDSNISVNSYEIRIGIENPWDKPKEIQPDTSSGVLPGINAMRLEVSDIITGATATWNIPGVSGIEQLQSFELPGWAPGTYRITVSGFWNDTAGGVFPSAGSESLSHILLQDSVTVKLDSDNKLAFITLRTPVSTVSEITEVRLYVSDTDSALGNSPDFTVTGMLEYLTGNASSLNLDGRYTIGTIQTDEKGERYYPMTITGLPVGSAIITMSLVFPSGVVRSDVEAMKLMPGISSSGLLDFRTAYEGTIPEYDPMRYWSRFTFEDKTDLPIIEFDGTRFLMPNDEGVLHSEDASTYRTLGYAIGAGDINGIASSGTEYILATSTIVTRAVPNDTGATWNTMSMPSGWSGAVGVAYGSGRFIAVNGGSSFVYATAGSTSFSSGASASFSLDKAYYLNGSFILVSDEGDIAVSNGSSITSQLSRAFGSGVTFYDIAYGNGIYAAVTSAGIYTTSSPTGTWTKASDDKAIAIAYGNGYFVAVAVDGGEDDGFHSQDGQTWTAIHSFNMDDSVPQDIAFGLEMFMVTGTDGVISYNTGE